jgi:hypothetical protein
VELAPWRQSQGWQHGASRSMKPLFSAEAEGAPKVQFAFGFDGELFEDNACRRTGSNITGNQAGVENSHEHLLRARASVVAKEFRGASIRIVKSRHSVSPASPREFTWESGLTPPFHLVATCNFALPTCPRPIHRERIGCAPEGEARGEQSRSPDAPGSAEEDMPEVHAPLAEA